MLNKGDFLRDMGGKIGKSIDKKGRLYFETPNENLLEVVDYLFNKMGCRLSTATGQETYCGIEALYHFSHDATGQYYCPRVVMTNKENPIMKSISPIINGAVWIEREMAEMLGITFEGHPRPEKLLTKDHPQNLTQPWRFRRLS